MTQIMARCVVALALPALSAAAWAASPAAVSTLRKFAVPHAVSAAPAPATSAKSEDRTTARANATHAGSVPGAVATQPQATTLPAVEVTAGPPDADIRTGRRLTPGAVHVVNAAKLDQRSVTNMAEALRYVPGVMAQSDTGGSSTVLSIRGSNLTALNYDNSGVMLFQDGLPVTSADGANHNRLLDPATARYVIVANGANALRYGASALGGAIDIISRTARNSDPRQLYLAGGAHDLFTGRLGMGGVAGNLDGMLTLEGKHFSGYRQHSRQNRVSVYGNAGWQVSNDLNLRVFATSIDDHQQLAGALTRSEFRNNPRQAAPAYAYGNHQLDVKTRRLAAKGTWTISPGSYLEFGLSWERQSLYHPIVDVLDFGTNPPTQYFSLLIDTTQRTLGGMVRYHLASGAHKLVVGINLAHTGNTGANYANQRGHRGARTDNIDQHAGNITLFALDRWRFAPRWTLVYGAQGIVTDRDLRDVSIPSRGAREQTATYTSINPRVGVLRKLGAHSEVFASVSRVYQPPDNFALDNDVRQNDATLDAMHGISWEVGTRSNAPVPFAAGTWRWSLALYYTRIHDEILSVENPAQPGTMLSTNYGRTTHAGIEARVGASFHVGGGANRIEPLISASWNRFRFDDDPTFGDNQLPYAPDFLVHGQILYRNQPTGFYIGPTFDWAGSRYADMANSYRVDGHFLVGLRAGIRLDQWEVYVEARNLTGKDYVSAVSVRTRAAADARVLKPGAPRSVFAGVRIRY